MKLTRNLLAAALAATATLSVISSADAATIFSHTFDEGTGALNGTTTDLGGLTWVAASTWNANGVYGTAPGSAMVSFTPSAGFTYTLDALIVSADNNPAAQFGFADGLSTGGVGLWGGNTSGNDANLATNQIRGKAWTLMRNKGKQYALDGLSLAGWTTEVTTNLPGRTMRIVLDTTDTTWTAEYFLSSGGSFVQVVAPKNLTSNSITSVGFGNVNSRGQIRSISLDAVSAPVAVPEPGSLAMGLLGMGTLLVARRRRQA